MRNLLFGILLFLSPIFALNCPNGTQEFNGYCYEMGISRLIDFTSADTYCSGRGLGNYSHLASIMNTFENSYIQQNLPAGAKAWIGGQQFGNSYSWNDGLPFSYNNVNTSTNGGSCLLFDKDTGKWLRSDCSEKHYFVCKLVETPPFKVSNSTGFYNAAAYVLRGIDPTANPCEDFFQFTCGTYIAKTKLHGADAVSIYDEAQTEVNNEIATALDSVNTASSLTERITKNAYDACVYNYNHRIADRSQVVYQDILKGFGLTELPLFQSPNTPFSISSNQLWSAVGYFEGTRAVGTLLNSYSSVDYKNITKNALFMDQPALELPRDYYVKPQFLTIMEDHVQEYAELIELWASDLKKTVDDATIQQLAADVVNFEIAIATASWPDEQMRNYQKINLFKSAGLSSSILSSNAAIVGEPSYFAWLNSVFTGNVYKQATIVNYITIQMVYDSVDFLADNFDALAEKRKFDDTDDYCVDVIMDFMPYGPGYVYVKQIGDANRKAVVADVSSQTNGIISAFTDMIGSLDWMTTNSKKNAYTKADGLIKNVGWPAMFKDFVDTSDLDKYHQDYAAIANMNKTQYWDIQLVLKSAIQAREAWRLLSAPADRTNFLESPAEVNAWYQPERNSITFPYAAFNPPYYKLDYPQAFNYGGQGGTGGHELTHGYDDEGVQFGPDGSLSGCDNFHCGWMDMNSTAGFTDMAQCVVTQYTTQCCPVKTGNVHCANGATTQGENIADLGGQQAAYRAYRNYVAKQLSGVEEPRLPGLEEYTPNQIFWISYGFSWCEKITQDALVQQLLVDPHAPSVCRVNNVMQDIPEFGRDFSCPKGSTMYPQDTNRCKVWVGQ
ncbi:unnamed protein product, partial [Mesorhabditis belari]|uniref:C-type lectin domain-containing protein n=1 Tax=Mesorhabditis belari TaxID=2138241 RepID=A0AAF3EEB4_9BILA